jgi:peptidoglycan hydrolase-like protein with peptidoglycan-binding domain
MPELQKEALHFESTVGAAADHPVTELAEYLVAPSTADKTNANVVRLALIPWACWKVEDICFDYDSAFVQPDAAQAFHELDKLCKKHPQAPLTLFGHADPVGDDAYNKTLSERRAKAVYAILTRNDALWEEIYQKEKLKFVQRTLKAMGHDPGPIDGATGSQTEAAIRSYQNSKGAVATGKDTKAMRSELFLDYMDILCGGLKLAPSNFLGEGACAHQGCGEFNPVRMFSEEQNKYYEQQSDKTERNDENQVNRRVVAFLFKPRTRIATSQWPCKANIQSCEKRFWSDWKDRRKFQQEGREHRAGEKLSGEASLEKWQYRASEDTFACRFYDRLAHFSPCESPRRSFRIRLLDPFARPIADAPYRLTSDVGQREGIADGDGWLVARDVPADETVTVEWAYKPAEGESPHYFFKLEIFVDLHEANEEDAGQRRLSNLGYNLGPQPSDNIKAFQRAYNLKDTGLLKDIKDLLWEYHDSANPSPKPMPGPGTIEEPEEPTPYDGVIND